MLQEEAVAPGPEILGHDFLQSFLGFIGSQRIDPAEAVGDTMHVYVHAERRLLERVNQDAVCGLAADTGQVKEGVDVVGYFAVVLLDEDFRQGDHSGRFRFGILRSVQQCEQLGLVGGSQRSRVGIAGKDAIGYCGGLLLTCSLRNDRGNKDLIGIAKLHGATAMVGCRQRLHDVADGFLIRRGSRRRRARLWHCRAHAKLLPLLRQSHLVLWNVT